MAKRSAKKKAKAPKKTAKAGTHPLKKKKTAKRAVPAAKKKTAPRKRSALKKVAAPKRSPSAAAPSAVPTQPRFYITTAIAYPNGAPHIGYGYEIITTDAIARFKRLDGYDVFFLTDTDEHGIKIAQTAAKEGNTPK